VAASEHGKTSMKIKRIAEWMLIVTFIPLMAILVSWEKCKKFTSERISGRKAVTSNES
jgi:hypothetical protein